MARSAPLIKDFGSNETVAEQAALPEVQQTEEKSEVGKKKVAQPAAALMQAEEWYKDSVRWQSTYLHYVVS